MSATGFDFERPNGTPVVLPTLSPSPAGTYTAANITVDIKGRVTAAADGAGPAGSPLLITDLPFDAAARGALRAAAGGSGNLTLGWVFQVLRAGITIKGVRGYWNVTGSYTLRCRLYNADGVQVARKDVAVTGAGIYVANFDTPVAPTLGVDYYVAVYEASGAKFTGNFVDSYAPAPPVQNLAVLLRDSGYASGEGPPTNLNGGALLYPISPVLGE